MDERTYCLTPEQWRHAKACLTLAKRWGLIEDDTPAALEKRRAAKKCCGRPLQGRRHDGVRRAPLFRPGLPAI